MEKHKSLGVQIKWETPQSSVFLSHMLPPPATSWVCVIFFPSIEDLLMTGTSHPCCSLSASHSCPGSFIFNLCVGLGLMKRISSWCPRARKAWKAPVLVARACDHQKYACYAGSSLIPELGYVSVQLRFVCADPLLLVVLHIKSSGTNWRVELFRPDLDA